MTVDVLVLTALKEELDALLQVRGEWTSTDCDPPLHTATLDGRSGPIRVAAARLTKMGGVATASLATRLIEMVKPRCITMCGVCAGHPEDTDLGDVVIAERLFQHDEGKIRHDGFQGDLWVDALRDDWLRIAQDMAGPGTTLDLFAAPSGDDWKWWFLERLAAGRDPLRSHALRRYIPDARRQEYLESLRKERLVKLQGTVYALTRAGKTSAAERRVLYGTLVTAYPFHIHVGPMGSGNAVEAGGVIWDRLAAGGMRKVLAVEMEAAAIGRVAHERGLPFAVVKGVMDHADGHKSDRFKGFAARVAAEVLCKLLRGVVIPPRVSSPMAASDPPVRGARSDGDREATRGAPPGKTGKSRAAPKTADVPAAEPALTADSAPTTKSKARPTKVAAKAPDEPPSSPLIVSADSGRWSAGEMEGRLADVLKSSEKLGKSLDARLPRGKSKVKTTKTATLALHERVARRIVELGTGLRTARGLVKACFDAVLARDSDAASELCIARELLCEWLPYGYPEVEQVVILRLERHTADRRNLEIRTAYEHFVEVHMARLNDRKCRFTRTTVDSRGGKCFAESMFPLPPASSERRSAEQVADLVVRVVGERFAIQRPVDVRSRIEVEALRGAAPYLVVPGALRPHGFPDAAIRKLNKDFPQLHVVVLNDATEVGVRADESMLWTMFIDILGDGV